MLDDQLLDEVECLLVVDVLPDLYDCAPGVGSELLFAIIALHVVLDELSDESLLDFGAVVEFFLDRHLDLYPLRVALRPDESRVDDAGLVQPLDLLEQDGQQFLAVAVAHHPWGHHVPAAESAIVHNGLLGDSDGDVSFGEHAGLADVAEGGLELDATDGAQDGGRLLYFHHC